MKINRLMAKKNSLHIYDPALCCSSGVCGVDADQVLIQFSADLDWLKQQDVTIKRFNLAHDPMAFATQPQIKTLLEQQGVEHLPAFILDEQLVLSGRYPTRDELAQWFDLVMLTSQSNSSKGCQSSGCC